jgi:hypothetical protein
MTIIELKKKYKIKFQKLLSFIIPASNWEMEGLIDSSIPIRAKNLICTDFKNLIFNSFKDLSFGYDDGKNFSFALFPLVGLYSGEINFSVSIR